MLFEKIRKILCEEYDFDEDDITLDTDFSEDLDFDELDMVDLVMYLEDMSEAEIPDEAFSAATVGDFIRIIEEN